MNPIKEAVLAYGQKTYGAKPDNPFPTAPTCSVLRHSDSGKLFALLMDVGRDRLGLDGEGRVDVLNLKCGSVVCGSLLMQPGYLPSYHMRLEGWITVLLDGTVPPEELYPLIDLSYTLTAGGKLRPRRGR